jgi:hypothetical protein
MIGVSARRVATVESQYRVSGAFAARVQRAVRTIEAPRQLPSAEGVSLAAAGHICGWAKVDEQWRCLQDYDAVGLAPETSCGANGAAAEGVASRDE